MIGECKFTDSKHLVEKYYTLGATIGTGHFAVVKIARHIFSELNVAVKVIDKTKLDDISKAHLFQEVMCMKLVRHPNVVRLYDVIDTPNKLYLILELADGGDMYDYITKNPTGLSEIVARKYFKQICQGLKYCHQMRVCHRDLKPENLVFFQKQDTVKLTDFGFSNRFSPGVKLATSCGSLAYSAPEILLGDPYDASAVDIWSLGVILFMLVTGRAPFQEANDSETVMMILDCSYKLPPSISAECQNLIHRMIIRDPEERATLDQVMSDVWYQQEEENTNHFSIDSYRSLSTTDHQSILHQMVDGNVADRETIMKALEDDHYNYITSTYYLLAEKIRRQRFEHDEPTAKRQRRLLHQISNEFPPEQINANLFSPVSPFGKENQSPATLSSPRHSIDSSHDQQLSIAVENEEDRLVSLQQQQRTAGAAIVPTSSSQAMKIIMEEDEYPDSPTSEKSILTAPQVVTQTKLNKIVENDDEYKKSSIINSSTDNEKNSSNNQDFRLISENRWRTILRSRSSSDGEDRVINHGSDNHTPGRNSNHSPHSLQDSDLIDNHRGRSFSNVEQLSADGFMRHHHPNSLINSSESAKRRSFSRTSSIISNSRLISHLTNDDVSFHTSGPNSFIFSPERSRSLSVEQRLGNPSTMSIASRFSIRYSTPRESTVFTKTDVPSIIRLLQQTPHHDTSEVIKTIIEHEKSYSNLSQTDQIKKEVIVEEDSFFPLHSGGETNSKLSINKKVTKDYSETNLNNVNSINQQMNNAQFDGASARSRSVVSTLLYSLNKHHQQREENSENLDNEEKKTKHPTARHRACCTVS